MRFMPSVPYFRRFQNIISELANDALSVRYYADSNKFRFYFVSRHDVTDLFVRNEVFGFGGSFTFVYDIIPCDLDVFSVPSPSCVVDVPLFPNLDRFLGSDCLVNSSFRSRRKKR